MIGPIDYSSLLAQLDTRPLQQLASTLREDKAFELRKQEQQERIQLAKAQFSQEQLENAEYQKDLADLSANFSAEKLRNMAWKHPQHQQALESGFATYNRGVQQDVIRSSTEVMSALASGNKDVALKVLDERLAALDRGGINSDQTTALRRLVQSDNPADAQRAYTMLGIIMSGAVGPEHAAGMMETMGIGVKAEDRRRDNERADADLEERRRHNRVVEGQGLRRIDLTSARTNPHGKSPPVPGDSGAPTSISTVGGKSYVKRGGKWYAQ